MAKYNKDRSRTASKQFKTDVTGIIYNSLVHDVPKHKVYGLIKREIAYFASENPGITLQEKGYLWSTALKMYSLSAKQAHFGLKQARRASTYQERLEKRSIAAFDVIKRNLIAGTSLSKATNDVINRVEARAKTADLEEKGEGSVFFLCDVHEPCAADHQAYQGRLYIKEDWELEVDDPKLAGEINAYLHNHPIMKTQTLEWVLGQKSSNKEPSPYLITRPNCKHHLMPVPVEEVLHGSVRKLLMSKKMIHKHEPERNAAERPYRAYKDRLDTLHNLWKVMPNEKLGKEISETNRLMKKWGRML